MGKLAMSLLLIIGIIILLFLIWEIYRYVKKRELDSHYDDMADRLEMEEITNRLEIQMDHADERERVRQSYREKPQKKGK